ncbi:MAG: lytic murein transglycosylase [Rhodospirillaceae bacterium]
MIFKERIPRRSALGVIAGAVLGGCQGKPIGEAPAAAGASPTAPPPEPTTTFVVSSQKFEQWLEGARTEAAKRGIGTKTIELALTNLEPNPKVVELDRRQPEFSQTFTRYLNNYVTDRRINEGRAQLAQRASLLTGLERDFGVQARYLVAFWGAETNYGRVMGDFPVITSLATLAFDGRRDELFRAELFNALTILDRGHIPLERMKGSWAGAMGNTQFMPSTFLRHAVDRDGDAHIDIWGSVPDALASAANYLRSMKWDGEGTWGREVKMPKGFDVGLASLDVEARENMRPLPEWARLGLRRADGGPLPGRDIAASFILPQGASGPAFLVYDNYRTILRWNRSAFYAIAIGHLADRLEGGPPFTTLLPAAEPLRRQEIVALQEGLIAEGFLEGTADGVMGALTRQGIRRFQRARGLPPDGYADQALIAAVTGA